MINYTAKDGLRFLRDIGIDLPLREKIEFKRNWQSVYREYNRDIVKTTTVLYCVNLPYMFNGNKNAHEQLIRRAKDLIVRLTIKNGDLEQMLPDTE